jgi:hypothetical protein
MAHNTSKAAIEKLVHALAHGATVEQAANKAGVGVRTAYRFRADPAFRKHLQEIQNETLRRLTGLLAGASLGSVKTLVTLQQDASTPAHVREKAARDVLELGLKFREKVDLEERVTAAEEKVAQIASDGSRTPEPQSEQGKEQQC